MYYPLILDACPDYNRQCENEACMCRGKFGPDSPAVRFDQSLTDGKPQADSLRLDVKESIKKSCAILDGDACTCVFHADPNIIGACIDGDLHWRLAVANSIVDQLG